MVSKVTDQVYGCIIGGAIGDALGAPIEGRSYKQIWTEYGKVKTFKPYDLPYSEGKAGRVTNDTVLRNIICIAIDENDGRITPNDFATTLQNHLNRERVWVPEEIVLQKLFLGGHPWETGRELIPSSIASSAIPPIGVINASDPAQAYQDGMNIASVIQDSIQRDGAATVAAGVASAFLPNASVKTVLETMKEAAPDILYRAIHLTINIADECNSVNDFVETYYETMLDWQWPAVQWDLNQYRKGELFSDNCLESIPVSMAILKLCGEDVNKSIIEAASFGRNCDAIASIVGSIAGALAGADAIHDEWIKQCEQANRVLFEEIERNSETGFYTLSLQLIEALERERKTTNKRIQLLDDLLDE